MMGEAGDFKCLTLVKLGPRPSKTGLFFRIKREPPLLCVLGSLATALREGGTTRDLLLFHYLSCGAAGRR